MIRSLTLPAIAACALAVGPAAAHAQAPAFVTGIVTDSSGGVLPGATMVALRGLRTVAAATTGQDGAYRLDLPSDGACRLTAHLDGFADAEAEVAAASAATADFRLEIAPLRDTVVVTASRTTEGRASVMESHAVITAEEIQTLGGSSVADVLRHVPGFSLEATGREGSLTSLYSRGGESDYNHVLIDGVRVNATGGDYDFGRVSAAEIERVEVVRGAQSALYGSDAIGSVIQIFTRRARRMESPACRGRSRAARSAPRAATCDSSAARAGVSTTSSASPTGARTARSGTAWPKRTASIRRRSTPTPAPSWATAPVCVPACATATPAPTPSGRSSTPPATPEPATTPTTCRGTSTSTSASRPASTMPPA